MSDSDDFPRKTLDLFEILTVLRERAVNSIWYGSNLECFGKGAEELYSFTDHNLPVSGKELLRITSTIYQTIDGDLKAFEPSTANHWLFIRAWDGTGFYFETIDPKIKKLFKNSFDCFEDVESEFQPKPPYVNFFLNFILRH